MKNKIKYALENVKEDTKSILEIIKDRPLTFAVYNLIFSVSIITEIKTHKKSYQAQVLTALGIQIIGYIGDEKINNRKRKTE